MVFAVAFLICLAVARGGLGEVREIEENVRELPATFYLGVSCLMLSGGCWIWWNQEARTVFARRLYTFLANCLLARRLEPQKRPHRCQRQPRVNPPRRSNQQTSNQAFDNASLFLSAKMDNTSRQHSCSSRSVGEPRLVVKRLGQLGTITEEGIRSLPPVV